MSKFILILLVLSSPALAQTALKNVVVKDGKAPIGWTCYDPKGLEAIDSAQKRGLDCEVKLKAVQQELDSLKKMNSQNAIVVNEYVAEWYNTTWFKIMAGAALGLTVGVVMGANF